MKKSVLFFLLTLCLGVAAGWSLMYRARGPLTELANGPGIGTVMPAAPAKPTPQAEQIAAPATSLERSLARSMAPTYANTLLKRGSFAKLDSEINDARERKVRLVGGDSKLYLMVSGLSEPNIGKNATDQEWKSHIATLNEWKKAAPHSLNPFLGLASAWTTYAYIARGEGLADTVSDASFELFQNRLLNAIDELRQAKDLGGGECPEWNRLMMNAEALYSSDRAGVEKFYEAGFRIDPTYYHLAATRAFFLQPKWGGRPGELERFIGQTADRVEGDDGKILYYELVASRQWEVRGDILRSGLSWPRIKEGYAALKDHYGTDNYTKNMFFYISTYANDIPTMTAASDEVGDNWDSEVWNRRDTFDMMKKAVVMMRESKLRTGQDPGGFSRN